MAKCTVLERSSSQRTFVGTRVRRRCLLTLGCILLASTCSLANERVFTVRDSIEMVRFFRDDAHVQFSPDARYFAVVTSRGILSSDKIESTLWIFSTARVRAFLQKNQATEAPHPFALARMAVVLRNNYTNDSYEPVITAFQWLYNSRGIIFQAQDTAGIRRLYRADLGSTLVRVITPANYDVTTFATAGNTIFYEASLSRTSQSIGERINADAVDLTGTLLFSALFSDASEVRQQEHMYDDDLWVLRNNRIHKVIAGESANASKLLSVLVPFPDGHAVVIVRPAPAILSSWNTFKPAPGLPTAKIQAGKPNAAHWSNFRPLEYTLVDVATGVMQPLIAAPQAWTLGWGHDAGAIVSPSATKVLLLNTFLPLEGANAAERARRRYPCMAALVDVYSKNAACLAFHSPNGEAEIVQTGSFGKNDNDILLTMKHLSNDALTYNRYHYENNIWRLVAFGEKPHALQAFSIVIRQDLNTPAALWATDPGIHKMKKLWEPNPQLIGMNLGTASILRWRDKSGYEWSAGLVKPPGYVPGRRYPLVIQNHGFNPKEFLSDGSFTSAFAARPLASAGMIVLQMEDNHQHRESLEEAPEQLLGYRSAIDRLNAMGLIDPKRVGIIGFSRSSYYVENAIIREPTLFIAASLNDGVDESYMTYLLAGENGYRLDPEQIYGTMPFGKGLQTWINKAPGFQLDRVRVPLLIAAIEPFSILGEWEIYASLRMQRKPVDFVYFPTGQHILQKPWERLASQQSNVDWFRFWLQGYEDPDPAKKAQYIRWNELRVLRKHSE